MVTKYFASQKDYEVVLLLLRRHWIILLAIIFRFFILAIIPFALFAFIENFFKDIEVLRAFFWLGTAVYFLFWWYGLFYQLADYVLDLWIVTDHRVVDIEQIGLFKRNIAETNLLNIQDITVTVSGILETFFSFGYVHIQTAGPLKETLFKQVPYPNEVKDIIFKYYYEYQKTHKDNVEIHEVTL